MLVGKPIFLEQGEAKMGEGVIGTGEGKIKTDWYF